MPDGRRGALLFRRAISLVGIRFPSWVLSCRIRGGAMRCSLPIVGPRLSFFPLARRFSIRMELLARKRCPRRIVIWVDWARGSRFGRRNSHSRSRGGGSRFGICVFLYSGSCNSSQACRARVVGEKWEIAAVASNVGYARVAGVLGAPPNSCALQAGNDVMRRRWL